MTDIQIDVEQINETREKISSLIENLSGDSNSLPAKMQEIEKQFGNLETMIVDFENNMVMLDTNEQMDARKHLQTFRIEKAKLETRYSEGKNRATLLGKAGMNVDGSSNTQRNSLVDQRGLIDEGNSLTLELALGASQAKDAGVGIISELSKQRDKTDEIEDKLGVLETDVTTGEGLVDVMLCRQKRRSIFMGIILFILAVAIVYFIILLLK